MTALITPSALYDAGLDFSQLAIPSVIVLLIALALRTMLVNTRNPRAEFLRRATSVTILPLAVVFVAAMSARLLAALAR